MTCEYTLRELDCFYTSREVAKQCLKTLKSKLEIQKISLADFDLWLEPSAGDGAFFNLLPPNRLGIDIQKSPNSDIKRADFLTWPIEHLTSKYKNIITIGNPPFGKNSSLAVKFFNRSAQFSSCIAMIFPRTFLKSSIQRRLNPYFYCETEINLPEKSFVFNSAPYAVPCVFQIWFKGHTKRKISLGPLSHNDFEFTTRNNADFAVQRVGVAAGKIKHNLNVVADASHYFIKSLGNKANVERNFGGIDWSPVKYNTAGNPSISKRELVKLYTANRN